MKYKYNVDNIRLDINYLSRKSFFPVCWSDISAMFVVFNTYACL